MNRTAKPIQENRHDALCMEYRGDFVLADVRVIVNETNSSAN